MRSSAAIRSGSTSSSANSPYKATCLHDRPALRHAIDGVAREGSCGAQVLPGTSGKGTMNDQAFAIRVQDVQSRAHGRWDEILCSLGVDERLLRRRNMACPLCGGTDRFQYTDRFGEGNYHCRNPHCGPGGGFKLLQAIFGWDFATTLKKVNACVGGLPVGSAAPPSAASAPERMTVLASRIWNEAVPVRPGDPVDQYLSARGLGQENY